MGSTGLLAATQYAPGATLGVWLLISHLRIVRKPRAFSDIHLF